VLIYGALAYYASERNAKRQEAVDAVKYWDERQPANMGRCFAVAYQLNVTELTAIWDREPVGEFAQHAKGLRECFADLDEWEFNKLYSNNVLTQKGSSLLAKKLRDALNSDEILAALIIDDIVDRRLLDTLWTSMECGYAKQLLQLLDMGDQVEQRRGHKPSRGPLRRFLEGCAGSK